MSFNMQNESIRISNVTSNESTHSCTKITWTHTHVHTYTYTYTHQFTEKRSIFRNRSFFCNHFRICSIKLFFFRTKFTTSIEIEEKFYTEELKNKFFFYICNFIDHSVIAYSAEKNKFKLNIFYSNLPSIGISS